MQNIEIRGAREHNLKNVDVDLPKGKLIVITGLSGSGKSSLAFDTLYAEGQRRYMESLSSYARQFLQMGKKPDVDSIEGIMPAISIDQKTTSNNPRSTVGTITEIYDHIRLLFARVGIPYSPSTGKPIEKQSVFEIAKKIIEHGVGIKIVILAPIGIGRKGEFKKEIDNAIKQGFQKVMLDSIIYDLDDMPIIEKNKKHDLFIVVDRIVLKGEIDPRLTDSIETALRISDDVVYIKKHEESEMELFSAKFCCPVSGFNIPKIEPNLFSFNSPYGLCKGCAGLGYRLEFNYDSLVQNDNLSISRGLFRHLVDSRGYQKFMLEMSKNGIDINMPWAKMNKEIREMVLKGDYYCKGIVGMISDVHDYYHEKKCNDCDGARLRKEALCIKVGGKNIFEVVNLNIKDVLSWIKSLKFEGNQKEIAQKIEKEIKNRLEFLLNVGLYYLTLSRTANTLSGGESQRIRLASQIGSGLTGVLYVLDEPSIGLHQSDNGKLIETVKNLRDLGNTVVVVEHDEDTIKESDYIIDIGKFAGKKGGEVIAKGTLKEIINNNESITTQYLNGKSQIKPNKDKRKETGYITIEGASANNLKNITVDFPLGNFICVTGVSGSGKSSLVLKSLYEGLSSQKNGFENYVLDGNDSFKRIKGADLIDKIIKIDQSPIGKTPRSNPATYTGLFTDIRDWFAITDEAKARGYNAGRFSFNVTGGRCEHCKGEGVIKVEMHFLPDVYVKCDKCEGKRYNRETLRVKYKGKSIYDVLEMTVDTAMDFFQKIPNIHKKLQTLDDVGLGYIKIGQMATTLSGGEAQRVKLAKELSKKMTDKTLYIFDEPTTGLHFYDVDVLLKIFHKICDMGSTIIVIEHNLDVIKSADHIIDIGPKGGDEGGKVIAKGSPNEIANNKNSLTGKFLKKLI